MKKNSTAFSLIEVLVANSIILVLLATFLPIYITISFERAVLKDRISITSDLHDELQRKIWLDANLEQIDKTVNKEEVQFVFTKEHAFIKGCANWKNKQGREEVICLYGLENG